MFKFFIGIFQWLNPIKWYNLFKQAQMFSEKPTIKLLQFDEYPQNRDFYRIRHTIYLPTLCQYIKKKELRLPSVQKVMGIIKRQKSKPFKDDAIRNREDYFNNPRTPFIEVIIHKNHPMLQKLLLYVECNNGAHVEFPLVPKD